MCPNSKLNFEISYFVLREQREGANSEILKRRKLKKKHNYVVLLIKGIQTQVGQAMGAHHISPRLEAN